MVHHKSLEVCQFRATRPKGKGWREAGTFRRPGLVFLQVSGADLRYAPRCMMPMIAGGSRGDTDLTFFQGGYYRQEQKHLRQASTGTGKAAARRRQAREKGTQERQTGSRPDSAEPSRLRGIDDGIPNSPVAGPPVAGAQACGHESGHHGRTVFGVAVPVSMVERNSFRSAKRTITNGMNSALPAVSVLEHVAAVAGALADVLDRLALGTPLLIAAQ